MLDLNSKVLCSAHSTKSSALHVILTGESRALWRTQDLIWKCHFPADEEMWGRTHAQSAALAVLLRNQLEPDLKVPRQHTALSSCPPTGASAQPVHSALHSCSSTTFYHIPLHRAPSCCPCHCLIHSQVGSFKNL